MFPLIHISASNDWASLDISLYFFTSVALIDNILHAAYFSAVFALKSLSSPDMILKLQVGRDAARSDFVQVFLGIPYASPPTGNYR